MKASEIDNERFERFAQAFQIGLLEAVTANPNDYAIRNFETPTGYATRVAAIMLRSIHANPLSVNYGGGGGFKRACRALGIKYTRASIFAFLRGDN